MSLLWLCPCLVKLVTFSWCGVPNLPQPTSYPFMYIDKNKSFDKSIKVKLPSLLGNYDRQTDRPTNQPTDPPTDQLADQPTNRQTDEH